MSDYDILLKIFMNCCQHITLLLRNGNLLTMGEEMGTNVSGDLVKYLDSKANDYIKEELLKCELVRAITSEEEETIIYSEFTEAPYMISFDPIDGSSNIKVNITVGTIFGVYKYNDNGQIENGSNLYMSAYSLYGASSQLVVAKKSNVSLFSYINNSYQLIKDKIKIPHKGKIYAVNESSKYLFLDHNVNKLINILIDEKYTHRWVGSLVADAHRTIINGGLFIYPANYNNPEGKIRLLYEAYPIAFIFEQADGIATNGDIPILDMPFPIKVHKRTPIYLSGNYELNIINNKFQQ
jgi:fructose-1,6-bisphosphatase I